MLYRLIDARENILGQFIGKIWAIAALLVVACVCLYLIFSMFGCSAYAQPSHQPTIDDRVTEKIRDSYSQATMTYDYSVLRYELRETDSVYLFGQQFPLDNPVVRRKFQEVLWFFRDRQGKLAILFYNMARWEPSLDSVRRSVMRDTLELLADMEYLMAQESWYDNSNTSWVGAAGSWQFMKSTGKEYGLKINGVVDERRHIIRAAEAAHIHFGELLTELKDPYFALAAYNAGLARVRRAKQKQRVQTYFDLYLARETNNYPFFIAALKLIDGDHERFTPWRKFLKSPTQVPVVTEKYVKLKQVSTMRDIAERLELDYSLFLELNQHIRVSLLPPGAYFFVVPK